MDWKAYRLSFEEKAEKIQKTMTLEEEVALMSGGETRKRVRGAILGKSGEHYNERPYQSGGCIEKDIPPLRFADGTRGVVCGRGKATCFPVAAMRGAAFDPKLEEAVGQAMAEEALDAGANFFGGVCVNLPYHPGWGRAQEVYGEDPELLARMGSAMVRGVQSTGVIACVKHFAFHSMENARLKVSVACGKRTEREVFLPHFKKCVEAGAGAFMSAYNSYQGILCGHHEYLLRKVLKGEWEFDGVVISDFVWGVKDTKAAVEGGLDMEMPSARFYGDALVQAVREGRVDRGLIDEAAKRIIRTFLAHREITEKRRKRKVDYSGHRRLAQKCAEEGMTLLKNNGQILPLRESHMRLVVLGELARQENTGDYGSSRVYAPYVVTLLEGLTKSPLGAEVIFYAGESETHCRRLAKGADAVVIVAGNDHRDEGERITPEGDRDDMAAGGDRTEGLGLKEKDLRMIRAVAQVRKDAIVVLIGGSVISMADWADDAGAILMAYYPGMEGGTALARVLTGEVCPGGKLPFVIAASESDFPEMDWEGNEVQYAYYHGYTLLNQKGVRPLYAFGYGLSYTSFRLGTVSGKSEGGRLYASVTVENTGEREGSEVLQLYVGAADSAVERPCYVLKDFEKVWLKPGEIRQAELSVALEDLAYFDETADRFVIEEIPYQLYVGTSSLREDLKMVEVAL